ncbi:MAG: hypothetical protein AABY32_00145 [Nanoarchaeota archaeon]
MDKELYKKKSIDEEIKQLVNEGNILEAQKVYFSEINNNHNIIKSQEDYFKGISKERSRLIRL